MDWSTLKSSRKLLLGTTNRKKLIELNAHLQPRGFELLTLADMPSFIDVEETGTTFLENARLKGKAQSVAQGLWTVGEDSGLCVPALAGDPGIYSARYSLQPGQNADATERAVIDQDNNDKLLREMHSVPDPQRDAYYVSAIVLCDPSGNVVLEVQGQCWGRILRQRRGTQGFGYDPLFEVIEYHQTFAELGLNVKRAISHRSCALREFLRQLDVKLDR
ncbi:MAG: RdgB/HAM1 family non-canonical purine NTP pyrophosphatase [Planctomycetota bacterium]|nr:RdgB/HAM1 family non-canonical purine NTP pyrophosphatase [Planctomycetota bacterium]